MKKLTGFRLVFLGIILYLPCFVWQLLAEEIPVWAFLVSAFLAGGCILVGLLQTWFKKPEELDDSMKETMRERKEWGDHYEES